MSAVTFMGAPVAVAGTFAVAGDVAPPFTLVTKELADYSPSSDSGKVLILNIFPSLDTPVCAQSVRTFNKEAAALDNVAVLCISADLPFAMGRFCETEGIDGVCSLSSFRSAAFGQDYGVAITDGPLAGLLARAVVVVNASGKVVYSQMVTEITDEPDYQAALTAARA